MAFLTPRTLPMTSPLSTSTAIHLLRRLPGVLRGGKPGAVLTAPQDVRNGASFLCPTGTSSAGKPSATNTTAATRTAPLPGTMPTLQHIRNPLANGTAERWYGHTPTPQRNEPHPLLVQASPRPLASMEASVDAGVSGEALESDADSGYGDADMDPGYDGDADFDDLPPLTRSEQREVELRYQREGLAAKWAHLGWLEQQPVAREPFAPFDASVDAQRPMDLESIRAALQQDADTYQSSLEAFDELPRSVSEVEVSVEALPTPQEASVPPAEDGHQQLMRQLLGFNLNTLRKIDTPITRPVENSITRMFSKGWTTMDTTHPDLDAESQSRTEVDAAIDPGTDNEWD